MEMTRGPSRERYQTVSTVYFILAILRTDLWSQRTFYVSKWKRDRRFTWSSEPREGLAACTAKEVPSFLSYFKTLSNGPAPDPLPPALQSSANPAVLRRLHFDILR